VVLVGLLAAVLAACLLGLVFQYRARKSSHHVGILRPWLGRVAGGSLGRDARAQGGMFAHTLHPRVGCSGTGQGAWA